MKKIWMLIGSIMLLFTTYQLVTTYAKYTNSATATVEKQAGAWVIKVNNQNLANSSGATTNFNIAGLNSQANSFVAQGKIAPSSSGYFDIVIDPTGCSVAVRYDITFGVGAISSINFSSVRKVVNNTETTDGIIKTGEKTYSGVINLADVKSGTATTVRLYIEWEDLANGAGDNADSALGLVQGSQVSLPVSVVVSQYSGETIENGV